MSFLSHRPAGLRRLKSQYVFLLALTVIASAVFSINKEPSGVPSDSELPAEGQNHIEPGDVGGSMPEFRASSGIRRSDIQDDDWRLQILAATNERYSRELRKEEQRNNESEAFVLNGRTIIRIADEMGDRITSAVFIRVSSEELDGSVPGYFVRGLRCASELRVPSDWETGNLPDAVLQPVTRLAKLRGYFLGSSGRENRSGLTTELLNYQQSSLLSYCQVRDQLNIRRSALLWEANHAALDSNRLNELLRTDPVSSSLTNQLENKNSSYLQGLLSLLPKDK